MAVMDLKKATVRLCDGRKATLTTTAASGVNGRFILTDATKHRGTKGPVRLTIVVAGLNTPLSISVSGYDITVNSATDGAGLATSTPNTIKTAIEASAAASALVDVTLPGTGASIVSAQAVTALGTGPRTLTVKIRDGMLTYTEKKNREYTKDRGALSTVRDGDEEPIEVKFDSIWDFIKASTGGTETPEDVVKNRGEASDWVTTGDDACQPFCCDIEVEYNPDCSGVEKEYITLEEFRYETLDRAFKDGNFSISGKCNTTEATISREA